MAHFGGVLFLVLALTACTAEQRSTGPEQPQTPPNGPLDTRIAFFENNASQLAQGGRYFSWYGCNGCHADGVQGPLDLNDRRSRRGLNFDQVFTAIADGHATMVPSYRDLIPTAQLWQITAFVRSLPSLPAGKRRRGDVDQVGEPQAAQWSGPVK
ncbi:MAG: cytochrome c [Novosphingobium sp.]|nr:cytochrome c [Novosphingobium sp.]